MFGNLERPVELFQIETLSPNFLMRATLQPVGTLPVYLNDRHRDYLRLNQVELEPLAAGRQMAGLTRSVMSVTRRNLFLLSLMVAEEAEKVQKLASKRPVVFYLPRFIVRGHLHISPEASNEDLLDETRDFYPVSDASIFPLEALAAQPTGQVPLLFLNRLHVDAYHVDQE
jgi:hypothetical protein